MIHNLIRDAVDGDIVMSVQHDAPLLSGEVHDEVWRVIDDTYRTITQIDMVDIRNRVWAAVRK